MAECSSILSNTAEAATFLSTLDGIATKSQTHPGIRNGTMHEVQTQLLLSSPAPSPHSYGTENMSDNFVDPNCTVCTRNSAAAAFCLTCFEYVCCRCRRHCQNERHQLVSDRIPAKSTIKTLQLEQVKCHKHDGQPLVSHCIKHDMICCQVCIKRSHKLCTFQTLEQLLINTDMGKLKDTALTELRKQYKRLMFAYKNLPRKASLLEKHKSEVLKQEQILKQELTDEIEKCHRAFLERIDTIFTNEVKIHEERLKLCKQSIHDITEDIRTVDQPKKVCESQQKKFVHLKNISRHKIRQYKTTGKDMRTHIESKGVEAEMTIVLNECAQNIKDECLKAISRVETPSKSQLTAEETATCTNSTSEWSTKCTDMVTNTETPFHKVEETGCYNYALSALLKSECSATKTDKFDKSNTAENKTHKDVSVQATPSTDDQQLDTSGLHLKEERHESSNSQEEQQETLNSREGQQKTLNLLEEPHEILNSQDFSVLMPESLDKQWFDFTRKSGEIVSDKLEFTVSKCNSLYPKVDKAALMQRTGTCDCKSPNGIDENITKRVSKHDGVNKIKCIGKQSCWMAGDEGTQTCITAIELLNNGAILVVDRKNKKVKLFDAESKDIFIGLDSEPLGMTKLRENVYMITLPSERVVQKIEVVPCAHGYEINKLEKIAVDTDCTDVVTVGTDILVIGYDSECASLIVMDEQGEMSHVEVDENGVTFKRPNYVCKSENENFLYISDADMGIYAFKWPNLSEPAFHYRSSDCLCPLGLTVNDSGHIYICAQQSKSVEVLSRDGRHIMKAEFDLKNEVYPQCIAYLPHLDEFIVACDNNYDMFHFKI